MRRHMKITLLLVGFLVVCGAVLAAYVYIYHAEEELINKSDMMSFQNQYDTSDFYENYLDSYFDCDFALNIVESTDNGDSSQFEGIHRFYYDGGWCTYQNHQNNNTQLCYIMFLNNTSQQQCAFLQVLCDGMEQLFLIDVDEDEKNAVNILIDPYSAVFLPIQIKINSCRNMDYHTLDFISIFSAYPKDETSSISDRQSAVLHVQAELEVSAGAETNIYAIPETLTPCSATNIQDSVPYITTAFSSAPEIPLNISWHEPEELYYVYPNSKEGMTYSTLVYIKMENIWVPLEQFYWQCGELQNCAIPLQDSMPQAPNCDIIIITYEISNSTGQVVSIQSTLDFCITTK